MLINPIDWDGDLEEDCSAFWYGLMLRAKKEAEYEWSWAVYDMEGGGHCLGKSEDEVTTCNSGGEARRAAEALAQKERGA